MQRLTIIHNVSCVYYRYAMIRKEYFDKVNGLTSEFSGINKSIDYSLKMLELGKQVVINPIVSFEVDKLLEDEKVDSEEQKFIQKWEAWFEKGDVYFSPNLDKHNPGILIKID